MGLSDTLLEDGFSHHILAVQGNEFKILTGVKAGTVFTALDQVAQAIDPETGQPLPADGREVISIHCATDPGLLPSDQVQGIGAKWLIETRQNNESDTSVDFTASKIVEGKDT